MLIAQCLSLGLREDSHSRTGYLKDTISRVILVLNEFVILRIFGSISLRVAAFVGKIQSWRDREDVEITI